MPRTERAHSFKARVRAIARIRRQARRQTSAQPGGAASVPACDRASTDNRCRSRRVASTRRLLRSTRDGRVSGCLPRIARRRLACDERYLRQTSGSFRASPSTRHDDAWSPVPRGGAACTASCTRPRAQSASSRKLGYFSQGGVKRGERPPGGMLLTSMSTSRRRPSPPRAASP